MRQKITWMHFLLIGISIVFTSTFKGCRKEEDFRVRARWVYLNDTQYQISFRPDGFWSDFDVAQNNSIVIEEEFEGPEVVTIDSYVPPIKAEYLVFDETRCITLIDIGLDRIQNYSPQRISDRYYEFTFRYTEENFNASVNCD